MLRDVPKTAPLVKISPLALFGAVLAASALPLFAAGSAVSTGTSAPPSTLGIYTLTPFQYDDPRVGFVNDVPSPLGGDVLFSSSMEVMTVGVEWGTWSHGYSGDVYAVDLQVLNVNSQYEVTLTLPPETGAFLFYAEPSFDGEFTISARLDDGTLLTQEVQGTQGAAGFGFLAPDGGSLSSITVLSEIANIDFAIGEFSIARTTALVPETGTTMAGIVAIGFAVVPILRRFRKK